MPASGTVWWLLSSVALHVLHRTNNITHIFSHGRYLVNATTSSGGGPNHE